MIMDLFSVEIHTQELPTRHQHISTLPSTPNGPTENAMPRHMEDAGRKRIAWALGCLNIGSPSSTTIHNWLVVERICLVI